MLDACNSAQTKFTISVIFYVRLSETDEQNVICSCVRMLPWHMTYATLELNANTTHPYRCIATVQRTIAIIRNLDIIKCSNEHTSRLITSELLQWNND